MCSYFTNVLENETVAPSIETMSIEPEEPPLLPWMLTNSKASDFAASKASSFYGVGFSNHRNFFDPTMVEEDVRIEKIWPTFVPTKEEIDDIGFELEYSLFDSLCTRVDMSVVSEKGSTIHDTTIQFDHLDKFTTFFNGILLSTTTSKKDLTLADLSCVEGCVSPRSVCDGYLIAGSEIIGSKPIRGIFEVNDNILTPSEGLRKAFSAGTNVAISLLRLGVPWDQIKVPLVSSNGYLMQFGCIALLEPSFPFMTVLSKVLDLIDPSDRRLAAAYLVKLRSYLQLPLPIAEAKLALTIPALPDSADGHVGLSSKHYYVKPIRNFFCSKHNIDSSLQHYFRIMGHLHERLGPDKRKVVLFPICVRVDDKEQQIVFPQLGPLKPVSITTTSSAASMTSIGRGKNNNGIVGPNMTNIYDYRIGLPPTPSLRRKFLQAVKEAMQWIHECNVAHLDFFLSNFMWKVKVKSNPTTSTSSTFTSSEKKEVVDKEAEDGDDGENDTEIVLKIIDWDSAHFCNETVSEKVMHSLKMSPTRIPLADAIKYTSRASFLERLDISLVDVLAAYLDDEVLRGNNKAVIDSRFRELQKMYLDRLSVPTSTSSSVPTDRLTDS